MAAKKAASSSGETEKILNEALARVKPSKKEELEVKKITEGILESLNRELKKIDAVAVLGGSGAKKTWLAGNHDIDIFAKFNYQKYGEDSIKDNLLLSNLLGLVLKKIYKEGQIERVHGSRDYFNLRLGDFIVEIVPVLDINNPENALNITDVSPMHADWVSWMVSKNKGIEDEIRLTKAFCKANNLYGAESYILGFSGYICEILTVHYGSFLNLLENAKDWEHGIIVDSRKHYKNKADVFQDLNKEKLRSPIIIIDPVQKDRNAAAAMSKEKFNAFKQAAKQFLSEPSAGLFLRKITTIESLKKSAGKNDLFVVYATPIKGKRDISGTKLFKAFEFICASLSRNEFKLIDSGWQWPAKDFVDENNDAMMWFIVSAEELSEKVKRAGPPVSAKEFFEDFKAKHKDIVIEKSRAYAYVKREFRTADKLFEALKKDNYIKDRVKDIKIERVN